MFRPRRSRGPAHHAAGGRTGPDVRQQVEDVLVGGRLRQRLQAEGLVPELDHTPTEEGGVNPDAVCVCHLFNYSLVQYKQGTTWCYRKELQLF